MEVYWWASLGFSSHVLGSNRFVYSVRSFLRNANINIPDV